MSNDKKNQQGQGKPQQKTTVVVFVGRRHQMRVAPEKVNRFVYDANVRISHEIRKPVMIVMHDQDITSVFAQIGNNLIADAVSPAERDVIHQILFDMLAK